MFFKNRLWFKLDRFQFSVPEIPSFKAAKGLLCVDLPSKNFEIFENGFLGVSILCSADFTGYDVASGFNSKLSSVMAKKKAKKGDRNYFRRVVLTKSTLKIELVLQT